jgi:predicted enzyme related to lactoylglutathione lyase
MIKIDHFYIKVTDLYKAINFYEKLLQMQISHREKDRWADFQKGSEVYFGILNTTVDGDFFTVGDNTTLALKTDDIEKEYLRIKELSPKSITEIVTITQPALYKYFQVEDEWGNVWEVAEYNY